MDITVVEVLDRILPAEDIDISNFALKSFEKQGIKIKTSSMVKSLKTLKGKISVQIETMAGSEEVSVEKVILAVGIIGNTENLGLENTSAKVSNGQLVVDKWGLHTNRVYTLLEI